MPPLAAAAPGLTSPNGEAELRAGCQAEAEAEVAAELAALGERREAEDRAACRFQDEAYAAYGKGDDKHGDQLHAKMLKHLHAATALAERCNTLGTPAEVTRRVQAKLARVRERARLSQLPKDDD